MTQIKKLGLGGFIAALFATMALATLVNTAYAAALVDVETRDDGGTAETVFETGDDGQIFIESANAGEAVLVTVNSVSTGEVEFSNGSDSTILVTTDANAEAVVEFEATAEGVVVFTVREVGEPDDALWSTVAITITGDVDTSISIELNGPAVIADDATAVEYEVSLEDADGDDVTDDGNFSWTVVGAVTNVVPNAEVVEFDADGDVGDTITVVVVDTVSGRSASATVSLGTDEAETVTVEGAAIAAGTTGEFTVTALDEDGDPIIDGEVPTVNASEGVAFGCSDTVAGESTCKLLAPNTTGTVTIVAAVGGATGTGTIQITAGTPVPGGDGTFVAPPVFGANGVGSAVFTGGSIEDLSAAVTAAGGTAVWAQGDDGNWYRYNTLATGATAFVNNAFIAEFGAGLGTIAVFVVE